MATEGEWIRKFRDFFEGSFTTEELKIFLTENGYGEVVAAVNQDVGSTVFFFEVAQELDRRGLIDREFFERLRRDRPRKVAQINALEQSRRTIVASEDFVAPMGSFGWYWHKNRALCRWKGLCALATLLMVVIVAVVLTWSLWKDHLPPLANAPIPKPEVPAHAVVDESRRSQRIETAADKLGKLFRKIEYNGHAAKTESFEDYRKRVESRFPFRGQVIIQPIRVGNQDLRDKQADISKQIVDLLEVFFAIKREQIKVADSLHPLILEEPKAAAGRVAVENIFERLHKQYNDNSPRAVLGITNRDMVSRDQICIRAVSDDDRWAAFSFARLLDADRGREYQGCQIQAFQLAAYCFVRTLKVKPCSTFVCGMNEDLNVAGMRDGKLPYDFCPECCKKIWWACEIEEPAERYGRLVKFAERYELMDKARDFWSEAERVLREPSGP